MVTDAVAHFNDNFSKHFAVLPEEGEQSLEQYAAWQKYSEVMEPLLSSKRSVGRVCGRGGAR